MTIQYKNIDVSDLATYTSAEAAALLRVSKQTLYRWKKSGQLVPIQYPGGAYRYTGSDIQAFISKHRQQECQEG